MANNKITFEEAKRRVALAGLYLTVIARSAPKMYVVKPNARALNTDPDAYHTMSLWDAVQMAGLMRRQKERGASPQYEMHIVPDTAEAREAIKNAFGWHCIERISRIQGLWVVATRHEVPNEFNLSVTLTYGNSEVVLVTMDWPWSPKRSGT
jgi:hypothetical protein